MLTLRPWSTDLDSPDPLRCSTPLPRAMRAAWRGGWALLLLLGSILPAGRSVASPPEQTATATATATDEAGGVESEASVAAAAASPGLMAIAPGTPWHLQLSGRLQEKAWAQVYDIDLFDTPSATIQSLRSRGKIVHCYFSAGSFEDWRPDKSKYPSSVLGKAMDGWPGERWVDIRSSALRSILQARMDLAKSKGCSGIDPDNVDGYGHDTGFPLKQSDTVNFLKWLSGEAHARGLSVGLKNGIEILSQVSSAMDWAVNEQCNEYSECSAYRAFVGSGKPVFNVEYKGSLSSICGRTKPLRLSTIKAPLALNGPSETCP